MARLPLLLLAFLLLPATSASAALSITGFWTPSRTTGCALIKFEGRTSFRCDLSRADNEPPPKPASCEFDYGFAFGMKPTGKARRLCVSDTPLDPDFRTLAYGETYKRSGITCRVTTERLRCENRSGHGFRLSRARQTIF